MERQTTVLPQATFRDTLAVLVLLLSLPPSLSALALALYAFFAVSTGSQTLTTALSRLLRGHPGDSENTLTPVPSKEKEKEKEKDKEERTTSSPLLLIALFDLFVCAVLHFTGPWLTRGIFVLAKALVAASVSGDRLLRVLLAVAVVACSELIFTASVGYLDHHFGVRISQAQQLFPLLVPHYSYTFDYSQYGVNYLATAINWTNLLLAVHVVLVAFASVFRTNFISKSLNQLTSNNDIPPTYSHLRVKDHTQAETRVIKIELTPDQAETKLVLDSSASSSTPSHSEQAPAAFIESHLTSNSVSSENIVSQNFEVYCSAPNKLRQRQPVWSLLAAVRAMSTSKDIYSGARAADADSDNALVLSDHINKYDDDMFANYDGANNLLRKEPIRIFIDYIGETLISFQLQNYYQGDIMIRVNGVVWYQVSRGYNGSDTSFIVGGLTPLSQYDIQFIIEEDDAHGKKRKHLIDDLIVSTVDNRGQGIPAEQTSGVLSPLVTLQESLITTNDNLSKERAKSKKQRKETTKKLNSMKTEIEQLRAKISSTDSVDKKNQKKLLSLKVSVKQAEEDVSRVDQRSAELEAELDELSEVYVVEKRRFDQFSRTYQLHKGAYLSKIDVKRSKLSEINVELDTLQAKREKLFTKLEKLKGEVEKLNGEIEHLCNADLSSRLQARERRAEKRKVLLGEFTKEIQRVEAACIRLLQDNESLRHHLNA